MVDALLIKLAGIDVGIIRNLGGHTSFAFLPSYRNLEVRPVLGQWFEDQLDRTWTTMVRVNPWFANVLPEGAMRRFLADQVSVNEQQDFPLLAALGQDLVGGATAHPIALTDGLEFEVQPAPVRSDSATEETGVRFSLAGYQLKLSMLDEGKGLTLPGRGLLGDHIVKLPSPGFPHVPENEHAMMSWARATGLNVPHTKLVEINDLDLPEGLKLSRGEVAFAIERFDRDRSNGRIHVEDFNQVLGQWPAEKYDNQSYDSLGTLVAGVTESEDDFFEFAKRVAFSVLIGNEDAHLKNFSLIYRTPTIARLAPAYDLVSTTTYEGLIRGLGLKVGQLRKMSDVTTGSFRRMARMANVGEGELERQLVQFVSDAMENRHEFVAAMGPLRPSLESHLDSLALVAI